MISTATESSPQITSKKSGAGSFKRRLLTFLIRIHNKYFVVIWILIAILTALAYPDAGIKKGPMKPEITADWVAVIIIFLISGLKIQTRDFLKAAQACKETIIIQLFIFILFPSVGYLIYTLMGAWNMESKLSIGVMLLSCCPTTVSTANIMVQMAGGNEPIAIINTKLNNFLGIVMTPALILFFLHQDTDVDFLETIIELLLSVAVPILVGQIIRFLIPAVAPFTKNHKKLVSRTSTMMIVYIVWATFSETFYNGIEATWKDMLATEGLLLVMFFVGHTVPWLFSVFVMDNTRDIKVALVICSGQKTVAMGLPLLTKMFQNEESLGLYTLPLIMYHATQILITGAILPYIQEWILSDPMLSDRESDETNKPSKNNKDQEKNYLALDDRESISEMNDDEDG